MNKNNSFQEVQGVLSLGYIYLIVMGILNETLYYNQLGIDILHYSSILDVMISPISRLTSSIMGFSFFIFLLIMLFFLPKHLIKKKDKTWFKKSFKLDDSLNEKEMETSFFKTFIFMFSLGLLGFYVGTGLGAGFKISKKIEKNEIEYQDNLVFIDGDSSQVKILGKNSSYVFYLTKENSTVKVSPINGMIRSIEESD